MGVTSAASAAAGQAMQQPSGLAGAMVPGIFSSAQQAMQQPLGLAGAITGMQQAQQQPQVGTAEQIANSNVVNMDPNNLSSSSTGLGQGLSMNPTEAEVATGNASDNVITAGMAVGDAPVATAGNFSPEAQFAARRMFGNGTQFVKPKKLINL